MNSTFAAPSLLFSRIEKREVAFWGTAAMAAVALHVAVALVLFLIRPAGDSIGAPVAMMVEFATLPSASATESESLTSDDTQPDQSEPVDNKPEPLEEAEEKTEPEPVVKEVLQEQTAKAEPEPMKEVVPQPVDAPTPEVNVPIPQPRPNIQPRPERRQADRSSREKAVPVEMARAQPNPAPPGKINRTQAASRGAGGTIPAGWSSQLQAWLLKHRRYPEASRPLREIGTVEIKFTIDIGGNVTSSRVSRSSGSPRLDQAALDMLHRASPVPPPPKSFDTASMQISIPVTFELR